MPIKIVVFILIALSGFVTGWHAIPPHFFVAEFVSHESKHVNGDPIYNRILLLTKGDEEIWMMQQQQKQYDSHFQKWDRLAIVVNNLQKTVQFYQLRPGPLEWTTETRQMAIPNKVNCLICHANGPRAIRPDPKTSLSWKNRLQIMLWNQRIKRSPRLSTEHVQQKNFDKDYPSAKSQLLIKACARCHNDSENGRGYLTTQHRFSIVFMLENHLMPPQSAALPKKELMEIAGFLK